MAGVSVESGGGSRKAVDSSVNMVPMIDLLISVIAFLLITAVWIQTGVLTASQPRRSNAVSPTITDSPISRLQINLASDHYQIALSEGEPFKTVPAGAGQLDQLRSLLQERHNADLRLQEIWVHPESNLKFDEVIRVMDIVYDVWDKDAPGNQPLSARVSIRFV